MIAFGCQATGVRFSHVGLSHDRGPLGIAGLQAGFVWLTQHFFKP